MADDMNQHIIITRQELADALDKAGEAGARRVLKEMGLDDEDAGDDIRELRKLITSWREVRSSALQAVVKFLTTALLGAILLGLGIKMGASNILGGGS